MVMSYNPCNMSYPYTLHYGCNSVSLSMLEMKNLCTTFNIQTQFCNDVTFIDTRIQQCCNTVSADDLMMWMEAQCNAADDLMMRMEAQCNAVDYLQKRINEDDALRNVSAMTTQEEREYLFDKYVTSRNYTLYADNKPIDSFYTSEEFKKHYTIYDLDRFIFPEDPIRDWVERKVAEINKKYSWVDQLDI